MPHTQSRKEGTFASNGGISSGKNKSRSMVCSMQDRGWKERAGGCWFRCLGSAEQRCLGSDEFSVLEAHCDRRGRTAVTGVSRLSWHRLEASWSRSYSDRFHKTNTFMQTAAIEIEKQVWPTRWRVAVRRVARSRLECNWPLYRRLCLLAA